MNFLYLDFEFSRTKEKYVNVVSCVTEDENGLIGKWWLHHDKKEQKKFCEYVKGFQVLVGYSTTAESRAMISLGLEPLDFKWIDLFLEYRCLTNHNYELMYGKQLVDGKVKMIPIPKPKWERTEEDHATGFSPTHSLAEASYKLLGVIRDTAHKTAMRDLIISDCPLYADHEVKAILNYGVEDVKDLKPMLGEMLKHYKKLDYEFEYDTWLDEAFDRGRYSAHTAHMESRGYGIDYDKTKNFSNQVGNILYDVQREITTSFTDIVPFSWDAKNNRYKMNTKNIKEWVKKNHDVNRWVKTDTDDISLSLEAFTRFYDFKHTYPKDNFGAQMVRLLKLKQSIFGFKNKRDDGKKTFWDYVGTDKRVRPYFNHYKAQSSRSQPAATGFMFLKPAWLRSLVKEEPGYAMGGIDYSSQEFLLNGLLADDIGMIEAYRSGDVYLAFGKDADMIPKHGTKAEYKAERDLCKSTVLGIGFLMTRIGLAVKLSADSGQEWTEDEAQGMINKFYEAYPDLKDYQEQIVEEYYQKKYLKLPCGWYLFKDNQNFRSVVNFTVQGFGAAVMRKAIDFCHEKGLEYIFTLHDAIYIRYKVGEEYKMELLRDAMREAFLYYWKGDEQKTDWASSIRLDPFAWSDSYEKDSEIKLATMNLPVTNVYIDDRSGDEYEQFKGYFESRAEDEL
jgi:hypothetical protein